MTILFIHGLLPGQYILDSLDGYIKAAQYSTLHNESEIFNLIQPEQSCTLIAKPLEIK